MNANPSWRQMRFVCEQFRRRWPTYQGKSPKSGRTSETWGAAQISCEPLGLRGAQVSCCHYLATTESSPAVFIISSTIGFRSGLWLESINVTSALLG